MASEFPRAPSCSCAAIIQTVRRPAGSFWPDDWVNKNYANDKLLSINLTILMVLLALGMTELERYFRFRWEIVVQWNSSLGDRPHDIVFMILFSWYDSSTHSHFTSGLKVWTLDALIERLNGIRNLLKLKEVERSCGHRIWLRPLARPIAS